MKNEGTNAGSTHMQPGQVHFVCYWTVRWLQWLVLSAIAVALLAPVIPASGLPRFDDSLKFIVENNKIINLTLVGLFTTFAVTRKCIGDPWLWDCIKGILSGFQKEAFSDVGEGELADHHRITLYRHYSFYLWPRRRGSSWWWPWGKWNHPWSGWLVPMVRAGSESAGATVFLACDAQRYDGVCGAAYFQQSATLEIPNLPDITKDSSEADIKEYARRTFASEELVKRRILRGHPCARYFLAHHVSVQYKTWGILMIDTRAAKIPAPMANHHRFKQIKDVLVHLLRRA